MSERKDMMEAPELRTHVFCRVTEDIGAVAVDDTGRAAWPWNICHWTVFCTDTKMWATLPA